MNHQTITLRLFVVLLMAHSSIEQNKQYCKTWKLEGECVAFKDCQFTKNLGFISDEIVLEIKDRNSACSMFGKGLICCEKNAGEKNPVRGETPQQQLSITQHQSIPTTRFQAFTTTKPIRHTINQQQNRQPVDYQKHPNYRYLKNLKCGSSSIFRISNGNDTKLFEFPWAARLGYLQFGEVDYRCAGTLISEYHVLTAAHCLVGLSPSSSLMIVRLGDWDTSKDIDCDYEDPTDPDCAGPAQDIGIDTFMAHPEFNRKVVLNDIGIVKLLIPADLKRRNIIPICLPLSPELLMLPKELFIVGWGRTEQTRKSLILQKALLPLYDQNDCRKKFTELFTKGQFVLTDGQFCAGGQGRIDACKGDSGSSAQYIGSVNGKQKMVQFGIVSYGIASCGVREGFPGIYTRVSHYLSWILDNMQ